MLMPMNVKVSNPKLSQNLLPTFFRNAQVRPLVSVDDAIFSPCAYLLQKFAVLFADMEGFTAWSSVRDPASGMCRDISLRMQSRQSLRQGQTNIVFSDFAVEVFHLLETVYSAFDEIADKRGVFKVETVGDSYVAVCGCPEKRKDHAVVMARFANDCCRRVATVLTRLEVDLGPDTSSLHFRFGLHSGPVTGGVLRGQRARFQLFGDTVNTAARIEGSTFRVALYTFVRLVCP